MSNLRFARRSAPPAKPAKGEVITWRDKKGAFKVTDSDGVSVDQLDYLGGGGMARQDPGAVAMSGGTARLTGGLGYNSSVRGSATQPTSKSTAVTMDAPTGEVTLHNETINAGTMKSFVLNNSAIEDGDHILVEHIRDGTFGSYVVGGRSTGAGTALIFVRNVQPSGNLGEAIVLKITVIKA